MIMSFTLLRILLIKTAKSDIVQNFNTILHMCYDLICMLTRIDGEVDWKLLELQLIVQCYSRTLPTAHKYSSDNISSTVRMMSMFGKPPCI